MPSPKNPFAGGGSMQGAPNMTIMPREPAYDGGQFADDVATPEEISVSHDRFWNEMPADRTNHMNATPEHSNPTYTGRQYDTIVKNPTGSQYGAMVEDLGQSPSKTSVDVSIHRTDRGKES